MAKTSLMDVSSLLDPLQAWRADILIPNMPYGGDTRQLTIKCQTFSMPGTSFEDVTTSLHGVDLKWAGRRMWQHTIQATFLETRDMTTWLALKQWFDGARNPVAHTGDYAVNYKTEGLIRIYDDAYVQVYQMQVKGLFIQSLDDMTFDGSSSQPVMLSATFSYDWVEA